MPGQNTVLFTRYASNRKKIVLPGRLLIIDCFFLLNAFREQNGSIESLQLLRLSADGREQRILEVTDAYDLYDVDRDAEGSEIVLLHEASSSCCYWDLHERYVVAAGPDSFLQAARPYPADIERHRYVEAMLGLDDSHEPDKPEDIYDVIARV